VILTTHDLRDIEELCSRILMIDKGKLIFNGSLGELRDKSLDSAQLTFSLSHALEKDWNADGLPSRGIIWQSKGASLTAILGREAPPRADVIRMVLDRYGQDVQDIAIAEPQIEHIVQQIYKAGSV
jgi:ABC-2 type transport system ATP-binding protein